MSSSLLLAIIGTALAGALGSVLRHEVVTRGGPPGSPRRARAVATVNLLGALVVAVVAVARPGPLWVWLWSVGLAGSLTTFSTWVVDAVLAREAGRAPLRVAGLDLIGQLAIGIAIVVVARHLG